MRRRNMYYATGLPGWMRFGCSPGWAGRSASGLGPCAQYLMSGQWPAPMAAGAASGNPAQSGRSERLAMLQAQAGMLEQQLQGIRAQLEELEEG